jgi:hypothetical protein
MNENDLRDCFAMFAMLGLIVNEGTLDDRMPNRAYLVADMMLEARNPEELGIAALKPKRKYARKEA